MEIGIARSHRRRTIVVHLIDHLRIGSVQIWRRMLICGIEMALRCAWLLLLFLWTRQIRRRRCIPRGFEECGRLTHVVINWIGHNILCEIGRFAERFIQIGGGNIAVQMLQIRFRQIGAVLMVLRRCV